MKTVLKSLLWGLETTRGLTLDAEAKLQSCQIWMFRKMLRLKRRPNPGGRDLEPWLEFHKRSLRSARNIIGRLGVCAATALGRNKSKWVKHILRMGTDGKPPHLVKAIFLWRPREWWEFQKLFNDIPSNSFTDVKHPPELGLPLRFEEQFAGKILNWWR